VGCILEELPETLDETYERVLRDINKANRHHAYRLLHCLTVAIRPLRVEELAEVLAIDFDRALQGGIPKSNPDWRWADQHQAVLSTCSSLITIVDDGDSQVAQFSHFSVKEFLTSDRLACSSENLSRYHISLKPAHTILAQACLGVLLRLGDGVNRHNAKDIPLAEYAARHWVDHARFEDVASNIRDAMEYFFDADKPHWAAWSRVYNIDQYWDWFSIRREVGVASPLYYASLCGFYDVVKSLICKHPDHINACGGRMAVPLVAALRGKYYDLAELLHFHGADVNVRGGAGYTPLSVASGVGRGDIALWLLDHGAEPNIRETSPSNWTPLHYAVYHGRLEAARTLLEYGADVNARSTMRRTPLHGAASPWSHDNQTDIMQLIFAYGADVHARDDRGSTPLHGPPSGSFGVWTVESMRLLLKHGADIDARDNNGRTPLHVAQEKGFSELVEFLSEQGATG
jgi:ankyrin repeat protein